MRGRSTSIAVLLPGVLLIATGCVATRGWVQETVGQRAAEIDQRVSTVDTERRQDATRIAQQGQRLEGVETSVRDGSRRLEGVEVSVREGSQRLEGIGQEANAANKAALDARLRADEVDGRLTRLWDRRNVRNLSDSVAVQFGFNRSDLDDAAQTALVALVREMQQNPKLLVELEGYADPKGDRDYNVVLSQRRVEAVRRYLVQNGIELSRINSIGLGPINDPKTSDASKRRVTVKVLVLAD
jgi:outer membrane protein OmpA-like peptidoglycan-associated protein